MRAAVVLTTILVAAAKSAQALLRKPPQAQGLRSLAVAGVIDGFSLINAATNTKVLDLSNGAVVDMSRISGMSAPTFNLQAFFTGDGIESVHFAHNAKPEFHTENYEPYTLCGDSGTNDVWSCSVLGLGHHTVTATPYSEDEAQGVAGEPYTVSFSIVSGTHSTSSNAKSNMVLYKSNLVNVMALSSTRVDVSSGPGSVQLQVSVQGSEVDITEAFIQPEGPSFVKGYGCPFLETNPSGVASCTVTLAFHQHIRRGNYSLVLMLAGSIEGDIRLTNSIEVLNTNEDTTPPILLSMYNTTATEVDVSSKSAIVHIVAVIQDEQAGFSSGSLESLDPDRPFRTNDVLEYSRYALAGDDGQVTINFIFDIGTYIKPTTYPLGLFLLDKVGNSVQLPVQELLPDVISPIITVRNDAFDDIPPTLLNVVALSPLKVNVSSAPATVTLQLLLRDDGSGVKNGIIELDEYDEDRYSFHFDEGVAGKDVAVNVSVVVPRNAALGRKTLKMQLRDDFGNSITVTSDMLANWSFPSAVEVIDTFEDNSPPKLMDLAVVSPTIVVGESLNQDQVILVTTTRDIGSGIDGVYVSAESSDNMYSISVYPTMDIVGEPIAGQPVQTNFSMELSRATKPGRYNLTVFVIDARGNYVAFETPALANMSLPTSIEIVNPGFDDRAPVLVDVEFMSASVVDDSLSPAVVVMQLTVYDNVAGIQKGTVSLWSRDADLYLSNISQAVFSDSATTAGAAKTYNVSLTSPRYLKSGNYELRVHLYDAAGNEGSVLLDDWFSSPSINVANTVEDTTPPELFNFTILSAMDVSHGLGATLDFELTASDDLAGLDYAMVQVYGPNGNDDYYASKEIWFSQAPMSASTPVTFNMSVILEPSFGQGFYVISVKLADATKQQTYLSSPELKESGFPHRIQIV